MNICEKYSDSKNEFCGAKIMNNPIISKYLYLFFNYSLSKTKFRSNVG